jgi:non-specific serine/threonine protein kinase/serine/threonine-protein kinase
MNAPRDDFWITVEAVVDAALQVPPSDRARLLDERCGGDLLLRAEIESLLSSHESAGAFLHDHPLDVAGLAVPPDLRGRTIGAFRLVDKIGEGGMGVVYRAERTSGDFTQRVAVKLLDAPVRDTDALRRFRSERQILASLSHPHIVTLVDGGLTGEGQPYLVMEHVDGVPITTYAAKRTLGLDERLRLFQQVCGAVQDAHQNGVVHRDLKPGNILVTADGIPKVLDFGLAKLVDASGAAIDATATGLLRPLTPNYASPEQLRGLSVTTVSDIYSLGVLLYELIAGVRCYDVTERSLEEIFRIVVEEEPRRPSAAIADAALPYDRHRLKGDLDTVVLKAMAKEPARRYGSARELSDDIGRHLAGRPVVARELSLGYAAAKLARRHRAAVTAAAVSLVALFAVLGVSLWQTRIAVRERHRADERFNDVRRLANTLIFKIHDGVAPLAGSTPVRQMIVGEALTYLERLSGDSGVDSVLRLELAKGYVRVGEVQGKPSVSNLGDRQGALASLRKAIALLRPLSLDGSVGRDATLDLVRANLSLSTTANFAGNSSEAIAAAREALAVSEGITRAKPNDGEAEALLASSEFQMALSLGPPDSLPHWIRAGEIFESLFAARPGDVGRRRNVALVQKYLGDYFFNQKDFERSLRHHLRALDLDERRLENDASNRQAQFDLAISLSNVASVEASIGRAAEAAARFERSLQMRHQLLASDPQDVLAQSRVAWVHSRLGPLYARLGRNVEARDHARRAVAVGEDMAAIDQAHRQLLSDYLLGLGDVERSLGDHRGACRSFRRAHTIATELSATAGTLRPDTGLVVSRVLKAAARALEACSPLTKPENSLN